MTVGEHLAQRGEIGDVLLRGVDDRQPLVECCKLSTEFCVLVCIDWPMRWVTASSRSDTARDSSACRPERVSPMVCTRPAVSAWMRAIHPLFQLLGMDIVARCLDAART